MTKAALPEGIVPRSPADTTPLDIGAVGQELARHGMAIDPDFEPCQFASGLANLNYLIRLDGGWAVLRRPPAGPLPRGANDMAREHRVLSNLWRALPIAPRSMHLCEDTDVIGVPFQILEFKQGAVIRGDRLEPLPPTAETGARLSALLVDTLARVHAVDVAGVGLDSLGRPEQFFARQSGGWLKRAEHVTDGHPPAAARDVADWLLACPEPEEAPPVLLHCDFKLDNMLLDPATLSANALLDWDMATRGPALFDLATMLSYWAEPGDPESMHRLAQMPTASPGFLNREAAAMAYARATGRSVDALPPYRVMTLFKLAVVFLQLHRRYVTGETRDPRYAGFGSLGHDLFIFALDVARGRYF